MSSETMSDEIVREIKAPRARAAMASLLNAA
jgi:hypothetical protein